MKTEVIYTQTFEKLLELCIQYLAPFSSEELVIERVLETIVRFENTVHAGEHALPISPHLLSLGVSTFREFTANGFRILYRQDKRENRIVVVLFCSQKQDISALLVDYCLHYL